MEQKNNSGALFGYAKKGAANAPDYTGSITVEGKKYALSGWVNTSKDGKSYLRLLLMPANKQGGESKTLPF